MTRTGPPFLLLAFLALFLHGCAGYTHDFALPRGAEGVHSVAIQIFKNKTLYQDIENEFTLALQREISAKTPLRIETRASADSLVAGAIESYEQTVLREDKVNNVARYSLALTVSYQFVRLPSGGAPEKVISSAQDLKRSVEYEVLSNQTESAARAEAVRKVARKVVSHIFETW